MRKMQIFAFSNRSLGRGVAAYTYFEYGVNISIRLVHFFSCVRSGSAVLRSSSMVFFLCRDTLLMELLG